MEKLAPMAKIAHAKKRTKDVIFSLAETTICIRYEKLWLSDTIRTTLIPDEQLRKRLKDPEKIVHNLLIVGVLKVLFAKHHDLLILDVSNFLFPKCECSDHRLADCFWQLPKNANTVAKDKDWAEQSPDFLIQKLR
jgi:hypothetical protein